MNIKIKDKTQLVELAARCIYVLSNTRAWQRDHEERNSQLNFGKPKDVEMWEIRADEFLKDIGATDFESLKELIKQLQECVDNADQA